ncbi:MAG: eCIS core domain-containing protein [Flavobacteriales bacterium]
MQVHSDKNNDKHIPSSIPSVSPSTPSSVQFKDNRPEATTQLKAQGMANQAVQRKENGTGIPDQLKSGIENLSGMDMSDVKVHYNSSKPAQLQAHAYAQGNQIHLGAGQEKHLPHEAWHVVQQKQGRVSPTKQLKSKVNINDDDGLEREADVMGAKALQFNRNKTAQLKSSSKNNYSTIQLAIIEHPIHGFYSDVEPEILKRNYFPNRKKAEDDEAKIRDKKTLSHEQPLSSTKQGFLPMVGATRLVDPLSRYLAHEELNPDRKKILDETITTHHQKALKSIGSKYTFAVRETGAGSIKRLDEGAKPKPHSILEKSIKKGSVDAAVKTNGSITRNASEELARYTEAGIDGFAGHWETIDDKKNSKPIGLKGVRTDGYPSKGPAADLLELTGFLDKKNQPDGTTYLPENRLEDFKRLHPNDWKTNLYTGDYDLHEVYDRRNMQIPEGFHKAGMINDLNEAVSEEARMRHSKDFEEGRVNDEQIPAHKLRAGKASSGRKTHITHVKDGNYAMFQHGDQATYVTNQHNEARAELAGPSGDYESHIHHTASVVRGVAAESPESMAWYHQGKYYVTKTLEEHNDMRNILRIKASSEWTGSASTERNAGDRLTEESGREGQGVLTGAPPLHQNYLRRERNAEEAHAKRIQDQGDKEEISLAKVTPRFTPKPPPPRR